MPDWIVSAFSPVGLLVVVVQQIPGIVRALRPPQVDPFARNSGSALVETLEKSFGIATVGLLILVVARFPVPQDWSAWSLIGAFVVLAAYYARYVSYYLGVTSLPVLLGMAAFPPLSFLLTALAQGNWPTMITSVAFGVVHVSLTYANFGPGAVGRDGGKALPG